MNKASISLEIMRLFKKKQILFIRLIDHSIKCILRVRVSVHLKCLLIFNGYNFYQGHLPVTNSSCHKDLTPIFYLSLLFPLINLHFYSQMN